MQQEMVRSETIEITYRDAVREAIRDAIKRDERVFLMGEDVGRYGGCYAVSKGLLAEFGPERIRDTPLSESGFTGAGIGAAMAGMRPIVELMTVNFSLLALDQILNSAATVRHMSGNQFGVPLVIRMATGAGRQVAAQHSHSLEGWYAHIPGIKVLAPATIEDARGMLWTALQDPDPVLIFENVMLYNMTGKLAAGAGPVDINGAAVRRPGRDISLITYGGSLWKTLDAATALAADKSMLKSSTCVACGRSMTRQSWPRLPRPGAQSSSTKAGAAAAWRQRLACVSSNRRSGSLMLRSAASAARRCRFLIPAILRTRRSRKLPRSWRLQRPCWVEHRGELWSNSACLPWVPIWRRALSWNGWSSLATGSNTATSSRWSRRRRVPLRLKLSNPARSSRS